MSSSAASELGLHGLSVIISLDTRNEWVTYGKMEVITLIINSSIIKKYYGVMLTLDIE